MFIDVVLFIDWRLPMMYYLSSRVMFTLFWGYFKIYIPIYELATFIFKSFFSQIRTYQKNLRYLPLMGINITASNESPLDTKKNVSSCSTLLHPPTRREVTAWKERFWLEFLENRQNFRSFSLPLCKLNLRDTVQRPTTTYISQNYRSFLQKGCVKVLP